MTREEKLAEEVSTFFDEYVRVTGQFQEPIVQTDWFLVPTLIDSSAVPGAGEDALKIFKTEEELNQFRREIEETYSGLNLSRAECRDIGVWPLNDKAVLLLAAARRFKEDGSAFPETRHLYLAIKQEAGWRIYANVSLDSEFLGPGGVPKSDEYWS